jgi:ADP-ribose pyrophosphatase YjhB (NUDIX family)
VAKWRVHGERAVYSSKWVNVHLIDVEQPDGHRFEHHAVRMQPVAAAVVLDDQDRVLLMWRHRAITDTWGWEIPTGIVEAGETPEQTAAREVKEETGWRPGPLTHLVSYEPSNGIADSRHHLYRADGATFEGGRSRSTRPIASSGFRWPTLATSSTKACCPMDRP